MTALTDRYLHAVLRELPSAQRAELEPEIRALVADAIDAHAGTGDRTTDAAERAALAELGDPSVLAARYTDRTQYVIGPALFPEWRRLLTVLLPIVVPTVSLVVLGANLLSEQTVGQAITAALGTGITVALQTIFWVTLVFFVIERVGASPTVPATGRTWTVDDLPELPAGGRIGILDTVALVSANVAVGIGLLWVQLQPPIVLDGQAFPLFDPALWSFWLPWFLFVTVLEIAFGVALYLRGRWTWGFAVANAALGAAFAIPAVYLISADLLFNPALVAKVEAATRATSWIEVTGIVIACVVLAVVAWDAIDGFRKAHAASRPMVASTQH
jgi:hypothetical protein